MKYTIGLFVAAFSVLAASAGVSRASIIYDVSLDTTPLIGHPAAFQPSGEFLLNFVFEDGSGPGTGSYVAVTNISFGSGGSADPSVYYTQGNVTGDLNSAPLVLTNTDGNGNLNEQAQGFVPGDTLSFELIVSTSVTNQTVPDLFEMQIYDGSLNPIATTGSSNGMDFLSLAINGQSPTLVGYPTNNGVSPEGDGDPITIAAASIVKVPEPTSLGLIGIAALALIKRSRRSVLSK